MQAKDLAHLFSVLSVLAYFYIVYDYKSGQWTDINDLNTKQNRNICTLICKKTQKTALVYLYADRVKCFRNVDYANCSNMTVIGFVDPEILTDLCPSINERTID